MNNAHFRDDSSCDVSAFYCDEPDFGDPYYQQYPWGNRPLFNEEPPYKRGQFIEDFYRFENRQDNFLEGTQESTYIDYSVATKRDVARAVLLIRHGFGIMHAYSADMQYNGRGRGMFPTPTRYLFPHPIIQATLAQLQEDPRINIPRLLDQQPLPSGPPHMFRRKPWQEPYGPERGHLRRRRSHLDDIYLPNYEDEEESVGCNTYESDAIENYHYGRYEQRRRPYPPVEQYRSNRPYNNKGSGGYSSNSIRKPTLAVPKIQFDHTKSSQDASRSNSRISETSEDKNIKKTSKTEATPVDDKQEKSHHDKDNKVASQVKNYKEKEKVEIKTAAHEAKKTNAIPTAYTGQESSKSTGITVNDKNDKTCSEESRKIDPKERLDKNIKKTSKAEETHVGDKQEKSHHDKDSKVASEVKNYKEKEKVETKTSARESNKTNDIPKTYTGQENSKSTGITVNDKNSKKCLEEEIRKIGPKERIEPHTNVDQKSQSSDTQILSSVKNKSHTQCKKYTGKETPENVAKNSKNETDNSVRKLDILATKLTTSMGKNVEGTSKTVESSKSNTTTMESMATTKQSITSSRSLLTSSNAATTVASAHNKVASSVKLSAKATNQMQCESRSRGNQLPSSALLKEVFPAEGAGKKLESSPKELEGSTTKLDILDRAGLENDPSKPTPRLTLRKIETLTESGANCKSAATNFDTDTLTVEYEKFTQEVTNCTQNVDIFTIKDQPKNDTELLHCLIPNDDNSTKKQNDQTCENVNKAGLELPVAPKIVELLEKDGTKANLKESESFNKSELKLPVTPKRCKPVEGDTIEFHEITKELECSNETEFLILPATPKRSEPVEQDTDFLETTRELENYSKTELELPATPKRANPLGDDIKSDLPSTKELEYSNKTELELPSTPKRPQLESEIKSVLLLTPDKSIYSDSTRELEHSANTELELPATPKMKVQKSSILTPETTISFNNSTIELNDPEIEPHSTPKKAKIEDDCEPTLPLTPKGIKKCIVINLKREASPKALVPLTKSSLSLNKSPLSSDKASAPLDEASTLLDRESESLAEASKSLDTASVPINKALESLDKASESLDKAPAPIDKAAAPLDKSPVTSDTAVISAKSNTFQDTGDSDCEIVSVTVLQTPEKTANSAANNKISDSAEKSDKTNGNDSASLNKHSDNIVQTSTVKDGPKTGDNKLSVVGEDSSKAGGTYDVCLEEVFILEDEIAEIDKKEHCRKSSDITLKKRSSCKTDQPIRSLSSTALSQITSNVVSSQISSVIDLTSNKSGEVSKDNTKCLDDLNASNRDKSNETKISYKDKLALHYSPVSSASNSPRVDDRPSNTAESFINSTIPPSSNFNVERTSRSSSRSNSPFSKVSSRSDTPSSKFSDDFLNIRHIDTTLSFMGHDRTMFDDTTVMDMDMGSPYSFDNKSVNNQTVRANVGGMAEDEITKDLLDKLEHFCNNDEVHLSKDSNGSDEKPSKIAATDQNSQKCDQNSNSLKPSAERNCSVNSHITTTGGTSPLVKLSPQGQNPVNTLNEVLEKRDVPLNVPGREKANLTQDISVLPNVIEQLHSEIKSARNQNFDDQNASEPSNYSKRSEVVDTQSLVEATYKSAKTADNSNKQLETKSKNSHNIGDNKKTTSKQSASIKGKSSIRDKSSSTKLKQEHRKHVKETPNNLDKNYFEKKKDDRQPKKDTRSEKADKSSNDTRSEKTDKSFTKKIKELVSKNLENFEVAKDTELKNMEQNSNKDKKEDSQNTKKLDVLEDKQRTELKDRQKYAVPSSNDLPDKKFSEVTQVTANNEDPGYYEVINSINADELLNKCGQMLKQDKEKSSTSNIFRSKSVEPPKVVEPKRRASLYIDLTNDDDEFESFLPARSLDYKDDLLLLMCNRGDNQLFKVNPKRKKSSYSSAETNTDQSKCDRVTNSLTDIQPNDSFKTSFKRKKIVKLRSSDDESEVESDLEPKAFQAKVVGTTAKRKKRMIIDSSSDEESATSAKPHQKVRKISERSTSGTESSSKYDKDKTKKYSAKSESRDKERRSSHFKEKRKHEASSSNGGSSPGSSSQKKPRESSRKSSVDDCNKIVSSELTSKQTSESVKKIDHRSSSERSSSDKKCKDEKRKTSSSSESVNKPSESTNSSSKVAQSPSENTDKVAEDSFKKGDLSSMSSNAKDPGKEKSESTKNISCESASSCKSLQELSEKVPSYSNDSKIRDKSENSKKTTSSQDILPSNSNISFEKKHASLNRSIGAFCGEPKNSPSYLFTKPKKPEFLTKADYEEKRNQQKISIPPIIDLEISSQVNVKKIKSRRSTFDVQANNDKILQRITSYDKISNIFGDEYVESDWEEQQKTVRSEPSNEQPLSENKSCETTAVTKSRKVDKHVSKHTTKKNDNQKPKVIAKFVSVVTTEVNKTQMQENRTNRYNTGQNFKKPDTVSSHSKIVELKKLSTLERRNSAPEITSCTPETVSHIPLNIKKPTESVLQPSHMYESCLFQCDAPKFEKLHRIIVVDNDCTDTAFISDPVTVSDNSEVVKHLEKSKSSEPVDLDSSGDDDVIEIPAQVPMIDLTDEGEPRVALTSGSTIDLTEDGPPKIELELPQTKSENDETLLNQTLLADTITLYRAEETTDVAEDVQAVVASISGNSFLVDNDKTASETVIKTDGVNGSKLDETIPNTYEDLVKKLELDKEDGNSNGKIASSNEDTDKSSSTTTATVPLEAVSQSLHSSEKIPANGSPSSTVEFQNNSVISTTSSNCSQQSLVPTATCTTNSTVLSQNSSVIPAVSVSVTSSTPVLTSVENGHNTQMCVNQNTSSVVTAVHSQSVQNQIPSVNTTNHDSANYVHGNIDYSRTPQVCGNTRYVNIQPRPTAPQQSVHSNQVLNTQNVSVPSVVPQQNNLDEMLEFVIKQNLPVQRPQTSLQQNFVETPTKSIQSWPTQHSQISSQQNNVQNQNGIAQHLLIQPSQISTEQNSVRNEMSAVVKTNVNQQVAPNVSANNMANASIPNTSQTVMPMPQKQNLNRPLQNTPVQQHRSMPTLQRALTRSTPGLSMPQFSPNCQENMAIPSSLSVPQSTNTDVHTSLTNEDISAIIKIFSEYIPIYSALSKTLDMFKQIPPSITPAKIVAEINFIRERIRSHARTLAVTLLGLNIKANMSLMQSSDRLIQATKAFLNLEMKVPMSHLTICVSMFDLMTPYFMDYSKNEFYMSLYTLLEYILKVLNERAQRNTVSADVNSATLTNSQTSELLSQMKEFNTILMKQHELMSKQTRSQSQNASTSTAEFQNSSVAPINNSNLSTAGTVGPPNMAPLRNYRNNRKRTANPSSQTFNVNQQQNTSMGDNMNPAANLNLNNNSFTQQVISMCNIATPQTNMTQQAQYVRPQAQQQIQGGKQQQQQHNIPRVPNVQPTTNQQIQGGRQQEQMPTILRVNSQAQQIPNVQPATNQQFQGGRHQEQIPIMTRVNPQQTQQISSDRPQMITSRVVNQPPPYNGFASQQNISNTFGGSQAYGTPVQPSYNSIRPQMNINSQPPPYHSSVPNPAPQANAPSFCGYSTQQSVRPQGNISTQIPLGCSNPNPMQYANTQVFTAPPPQNTYVHPRNVQQNTQNSMPNSSPRHVQGEAQNQGPQVFAMPPSRRNVQPAKNTNTFVSSSALQNLMSFIDPIGNPPQSCPPPCNTQKSVSIPPNRMVREYRDTPRYEYQDIVRPNLAPYSIANPHQYVGKQSGASPQDKTRNESLLNELLSSTSSFNTPANTKPHIRGFKLPPDYQNKNTNKESLSARNKPLFKITLPFTQPQTSGPSNTAPVATSATISDTCETRPAAFAQISVPYSSPTGSEQSSIGGAMNTLSQVNSAWSNSASQASGMVTSNNNSRNWNTAASQASNSNFVVSQALSLAASNINSSWSSSIPHATQLQASRLDQCLTAVTTSNTTPRASVNSNLSNGGSQTSEVQASGLGQVSTASVCLNAASVDENLAQRSDAPETAHITLRALLNGCGASNNSEVSAPSTHNEVATARETSQNGVMVISDDSNSSSEETPQNDGQKVKYNGEDNQIETIDLTWMDDLDVGELQQNLKFVFVKKEEERDEADADNGAVNDMMVVPSPADSGICSPTYQNEQPETVYIEKICICGVDATYICDCNNAWYCSQDCQLSDWDSHKTTCQRLTPDSNNIRSNENEGTT